MLSAVRPVARDRTDGVEASLDSSPPALPRFSGAESQKLEILRLRGAIRQRIARLRSGWQDEEWCEGTRRLLSAANT